MQITIDRNDLALLITEALRHKNLIVEERQNFQVLDITQDSKTITLSNNKGSQIVIDKNASFVIEENSIKYGNNSFAFYNHKLTTAELINTLCYLQDG